MSAEPIVEYLTTARIGEKGQLTIPKEYRDALDLKAGAPVAVLRIGDGLLLLPEDARFRQLCQSIRSILRGAGITEEEVVAALPEARRRVFAEQYPELAAREPSRPRRKRGQRA
ncbi:MAG TPA: AbrB/MazE/SpoVT family DNA-binding domain-containing protein [Blastocatellia bacterium]|nr:AbrB/MazE/SpoVT family DNA-binding domain-containing protein [Blastocatellia bacterium]